MSEEEKGFVVKDRRAFDEKGTVKKEEAKPEQKTSGREKEPRTGRMPLPEANFSTFIFSLSSTALFHMGEIADPQTGERKQDLPLAKHSIDTLGMLWEKTKGNLTQEEGKFLDSILTELRLRYVKITK